MAASGVLAGRDVDDPVARACGVAAVEVHQVLVVIHDQHSDIVGGGEDDANGERVIIAGQFERPILGGQHLAQQAGVRVGAVGGRAGRAG